MCASGPVTKTKKPGLWSRPSVGPGGGGWYAAAVVLHLLGAAALIWLTPLRSVLGVAPDKRNSAVERMSSREIQKVSKTVEKSTTSRLMRQLEQLDTIKHEMKKMEEERLEKLRQDMPPKVEVDPLAALEAMRRAEAAMHQTAKAIDEDKTPEGEPRESKMNEIDSRLKEATNRLPELEEQFRPVLSALVETRSLQDRARQSWTKRAEEERESPRERAQREAKARIEDYHNRSDDLKEREKQVAELYAEVEQERAELAKLIQQRAATTEDRDLKDLDKGIARLEKDIPRHVSRAEGKASATEGKRRDLAVAKDRADAAQRALDSVLQDIEMERRRVEESQVAAAEWQRRAIDEQQRTIALMEKALKGKAVQPDRPESRPKSLEEAYERAQQREREITDTYKTLRAADLSMLQEMPLSEALHQTDVVRPERPKLDIASNNEEIQSPEDLERRKQQLENVLQETGSMVNLAQTLLHLTKRQAAERAQGPEIALETARQREQERLRLASADLSGRVADMTGTAGGEPGSGEPGAGAGGAPGTGAGTGGGAPGTGAGTGAGTGGGGPGGPGGNGPGTSRWPADGLAGFTPPQEVSLGRIDAFERKISPEGDPARWMSINSWYIIGPFANPGRNNIDRRYPPESVIDLDATYIGKHDDILRWQYQPAESVKVIPRNEEPYGIWYATTEIWSDTDRDVWLSMGSDDKGLLWVNGQLVWISASRHKDWTIGEALRRVHLSAGRNRLLYRIENGHGGMAFSLCLWLEDQG